MMGYLMGHFLEVRLQKSFCRIFLNSPSQDCAHLHSYQSRVCLSVCLSLLLLQQSILTFSCRDTVPHNMAVYHVGSFFFKLITAYCLIYEGYLRVSFISKLLNLLNCQGFSCYTDYITCMQMLLQLLSLILMQCVCHLPVCISTPCQIQQSRQGSLTCAHAGSLFIKRLVLRLDYIYLINYFM